MPLKFRWLGNIQLLNVCATKPIERQNGKQSIIGQNLNYANKFYSDEKNRTQWVDAFHDDAVKKGMILGTGKAIHAHGTVNELKGKMPKPFQVILPKDFKGV